MTDDKLGKYSCIHNTMAWFTPHCQQERFANILTEQRACADYLIEHGPDRGAQLGLADWTAEEILERGE